jgi:rSAM/selenodomain-associated transferase 1
MSDTETTALSRLIVFTRYPVPGRAKTRLIPVLGADGAADLQRRMTEHVLKQVEALAARPAVAVEVRFDGGDVSKMSRWLGPRWSYRPQGQGDIGARMARALSAAFAEGAPAAALIGTDIPDLSTAILAEAFQWLADHDIVLGPAADGGYYLVGARQKRFVELAPRLFQGISWGAEHVLRDTLSALAAARARVHLLSLLRDIDRPEDLAVREAAEP